MFVDPHLSVVTREGAQLKKKKKKSTATPNYKTRGVEVCREVELLTGAALVKTPLSVGCEEAGQEGKV